MKKFQRINYLLSIISFIYIVITIVEFIQYYPNYDYKLSDLPLDFIILIYSITSFLFAFYSNKFLLQEEKDTNLNEEININKLKTLTFVNILNSALTLFFSFFIFYNFYIGVIKDFSFDNIGLDILLIPLLGILVLLISIAQYYYSKIILKKIRAK